MDEKTQYSLIIKNSKDKVLNGLPIGALILLFVFNILFELVSVEFNLALILTASFWLKLFIKYIVLVVVFIIIYGWFKDLFCDKETALAIRISAQKVADELTTKKLTKLYKIYTKTEMAKEEEDFFKELLNDCGNIDTKYLDRFYTIKKLRIEKKNDNINKYQFKLLKNIKTGHISFAKLTGDEIKYVGQFNVPKNRKYTNGQSRIILSEFIWKIVIMLFMAMAIELLLDSIRHGSADGETKLSALESALKIFSITMNYVTAIMFAYKTAQKSANEYIRFTEAVTLFTKGFLETINDNKEEEVKPNGDLRGQTQDTDTNTNEQQ